ncbi:transglutaminase family protein [Chloroflexota bacterium]
MNDINLYLKPTEAINSDHKAIRKAAAELTINCISDAEKAVKLFNFVRDSIRFNPYMVSVYFQDFIASTILERGKGYCVHKAVILAALSRAAGIPTRLCFAKIRNHKVHPDVFKLLGTDVFIRHGYDQFYLEGKWINVASTFDKLLCQKNRLRVVEFDGVHDAFLPETDMDGNPHVDYMEVYGPQADLPFEWVVKEVAKFWGPQKKAWLSKKDSEGYITPQQH